MTKCRDCRAEVVWARTEAGVRVAFDPEPHADGFAQLWETENGEMLSFVEQYVPGEGYIFSVPQEAAKEWFGVFLPHDKTCSEGITDDPRAVSA